MNKDYDMQPRPLHEQLPCMGTTAGCGTTIGNGGDRDWGAGGGAGTELLDYASSIDAQNALGAIVPMTEEAETAWRIMRQTIQNASRSTDPAVRAASAYMAAGLLDLASRAQVLIYLRPQQPEDEYPAQTDWQTGPNGGTSRVLHIHIDPIKGTHGLPMNVVLAHEFGHAISMARGFGHFSPQSMTSSIRYENAMRTMMGCRSERHNHNHVDPCF